MTAELAELLWEALGKVSSRIVNEVKGVNQVLYDCTGNPLTTIEFESFRMSEKLILLDF